ncbi:glycoside hydrolase family 9 protein [Streptomyces litchfieldiae]|uniref:Endoglucanase n=1 Tax=Streptomyces litchfieldiae TaxID=3075543 RepID=A0ABU2MWZ9_9ACTN|nr:glycoside hydrolase family 9 protein [Streptomyces sp. DSM 44938]MDT0346172.1 glycoside hydrolase family 9 protein [Streptomyces sp. DSM 44938]
MGAALAAGLATSALSVSTASAEGPELISNGDFASGAIAPWWSTPNAPAAVVDGRLCAEVEGGTVNPWDAIVGQDGLPLTAGESYELTYTASSSVPITSRTNVQLAEEPWTQELAALDPVTETAQTFTHVFTASADYTAAQLAFQIGGSADPFTFCLDDVSLTGGAEPPVYEPDTGSPVRVNQVGYLTNGPKTGTFVTEATAALPWTLNAADGSEAATGTTTPLGVDPTSAQNVHSFDFSDVTEAGDGYTVTIDGQTSEPFAIGDDLYSSLRSDALAYFYHNRSGIEIDADLVGAEYARPAGHVNVAPNQGDDGVTCWAADPCDYTLDAAGGWYDAGDHGKYVVNGGISVAQLLSSYERTLTTEGADGEPLGDGALAVPEQGNGVPDILDEARWQLEFLVSMQVPAGEELAGMAHHKLHDREWTGLPLRPDQDPQPRELHPPSTAATLNLAAAAAQGARLFEEYDPAFAEELRTAAVTAYAAAEANPAIYADPNDGVGGGAYSDNNVTDEFYWAASELFITTGEDAYRQDVLGSEVHGDAEATFPRGGFGWGSTAALGALSLATVDNGLTADQLAGVRATLAEAADGFAADAQAAAYGVPLAGADNYVWGSNSQVMNNMVVLAVAHDLTGDNTYRDAVLSGFDYLLGRNPLNLSYVTGYGERDVENQHHRFWANQLNASLPNPPAGSVAGGPNSALQDPIAEDMLQGCAPAMCYIDHIESYATNEVTINWNAPLAWLASYADDLGAGEGDTGEEPATCEVSYNSYRWNSGFTSSVTIKNTGTTPISPWELTWTFADNQRITNAWNASVTQTGRDVVARPAAWNGTVQPGGSVNFGFQGTASGAVADPQSFSLNGGACTTG